MGLSEKNVVYPGMMIMMMMILTQLFNVPMELKGSMFGQTHIYIYNNKYIYLYIYIYVMSQQCNPNPLMMNTNKNRFGI